MPLLPASYASALLLVALLVDPNPPAAQTTARGVAETDALATFLERVDAYTKLRKEVAASLPALDKDADVLAITARQRTLGDHITKARGSAREGDLFVAPARTHIKQQITSLLSGVKGAERLAAIEEERSERRLAARVNARYLDGVPVSMVPPDILSALPRLPREVEYHFLERHLILLDGDARIILDVLRDVLPRR